MSSETYHEPYETLSAEVREMHRALVSLGEELDAIDWYGQRAAASTDAELREVILHNRREEIEHAMMVLEWIRRHDPDFDAKSRTYLFQTAPITEIETIEEQGQTEGTSAANRREAGSLGIGGLKGGPDE